MGLFVSKLPDGAVEALQASPYLVGTPKHAYSRLAELGEVVEIQSDSPIYRRGDFADSFFLILDGEVTMWAKDQLLRTWMSGEGFGEEALARNGEMLRVASATASRDCILLEFERATFQRERARPWMRAFAESIDTINRHRKAQFLRSVPFLRSATVNTELLDRVAELFSYQVFDYDVQICEEGAVPEAFYIVCSGRVASFMLMNDMEVSLHELRSGDFFGEVALVERMPNTSTLRSLNRTLLLVLPASSFDKLLAVSPDVSTLLSLQGRQRTAAALKRYRVPFFNSLSDHSMERLASLCRLRQYETGAVICTVGDPGDIFYIVTHGELTAEVPDRGVVRMLHTGTYFGEIALVADLPRSATVTVTGKDAVLLEIGKDDFHAIFSHEPSALAEIEIKVLGEHAQLYSILNLEAATAYFVRHLETEHAEENIEFWRIADRFLKTHATLEASWATVPREGPASAGDSAVPANPRSSPFETAARRKQPRNRSPSPSGTDGTPARPSNNPLFDVKDQKIQRSLARRRDEALSIYHTYIRAGAPKQVNVDGYERERIGRFVDRDAFPVTLFEAAQTEIYHVMDRDNFSRFQKSQLFQEMLEKVDAYRRPRVDRKSELNIRSERKSRPSLFGWAS